MMCHISFLIIALSLFDVCLCRSHKTNFKDKLNDVEWQCSTICEGSGGKSEYNYENKICKCILNRDMNDEDINLMVKNARLLGLILQTYEDFSEGNLSKKVKRDIVPTPKKENVSKNAAMPVIVSKNAPAPVLAVAPTTSTTPKPIIEAPTTAEPLLGQRRGAAGGRVIPQFRSRQAGHGNQQTVQQRLEQWRSQMRQHTSTVTRGRQARPTLRPPRLPGHGLNQGQGRLSRTRGHFGIRQRQGHNRGHGRLGSAPTEVSTPKSTPITQDPTLVDSDED